LRYNEQNNVASGGAGIPFIQLYNMNSIFDPDRTGVGHQPYGHDTYQTLYNRYRVLKFRYRVVLAPNSATVANVVVVPLNNVSTIDFISLTEQSTYAKPRILSLSGMSECVYTGTVDLAKLNGSTASAYKDDDRFEAVFGTSPSELMGLYLCFQGNTAAVTIQYNVILEYYCELFDPIALTQS